MKDIQQGGDVGDDRDEEKEQPQLLRARKIARVLPVVLTVCPLPTSSRCTELDMSSARR